MIQPEKPRLSFWLKLLYGSGDWGISSVGMMRSIFYAIYLTDVVGLEPRLASWGALVGIVWDAVNDPIIGILSDRLKTRWGRRRPFLLWFAIPFGLSFIILWSAPDWDSQAALLAYVTLSFMLADTMQTLVSVPFLSLTPELTPDYDERTTLTSFRSLFQLIGALSVVIAAPMIVDLVIESGGTQQQGFMLVGAIFGAIGAIPLLLIGIFVRERSTPEQQQAMPFRETLRAAWQNVPFRFSVGMHMLNWSAVDMVAVTFPYFLLYWVAQGDLLAKINILGINLAYESAFFGILMSVCILLHTVLVVGGKETQQTRGVYARHDLLGCSGVADLHHSTGGNNLSPVHRRAGRDRRIRRVRPARCDVRRRDRMGRTPHATQAGGHLLRCPRPHPQIDGRAGHFCHTAVAGLDGVSNPSCGSTQFMQPASVVAMIRLLVSPIGAMMLSGTIVFAWLFPLSREKHRRIQRLLARRRERSNTLVNERGMPDETAI
jgi:glycoside/pentoside/hexuronide:cation symporter, GPH family